MKLLLTMKTWSSQISLTFKLYSIIAVFVSVIIVMIAINKFGVDTLSGFRGYLTALHQWSMAHKEAIYYLNKYHTSRNEQYLQLFHKKLKLHLGYKTFRLEIVKKDPDLQVAYIGLSAGQSSPEDFKDMVNLFRRFHNVHYIEMLLAIWAQGDEEIAQLEILGHHLQQVHERHSEKEHSIFDEISKVNDKLITLENRFEVVIDEASRWTTSLLWKITLFCFIMGGLLGTLLIYLIARSLTTRITSLTQAMEKVAKGDLNTICNDKTKDEIGNLSRCFNQMTEDLKLATQNEKELAVTLATIESEKKKNLELQALNQQLEAKEQGLFTSSEALKNKMVELERFNKIMIGRELDIIALKEEINALLLRLDEPLKYAGRTNNLSK
ncbi:MAG: HAMP domain-containing protein [Oligoflexia bacterium]|nr:HAMP domain-containing protein [Oligoflexia bacterium]